MVSTYLSYTLLTRDMAKSLSRVADQQQVSREAQYYKENIGKVASLDAFLKDHRLYSYSMTANGLEDMIYAKAFMKKVLESDLNKENSFANRLTDTRYRKFAEAFNFSKQSAALQTPAQLDKIIGLYNTTIENAASAISEETRYYNIAVDKVTNVDQLLRNDRLRGYVFTVFGIDEKTYDYANIKSVLSSDPNDPDSYLNKTMVPRAAQAQSTISEQRTLENTARTRKIQLENELKGNITGKDVTAMKAEVASLTAEIAKINTRISDQSRTLTMIGKFEQMASAFNFKADGTLPAGATAQTAANKKLSNEIYTTATPRVTPAAAVLNKQYFEANIGNVTKVTDLTDDARMLNYIKVAFDLNEITDVKAKIENILTSDASDPDNYIEKYGNKNQKFIDLRDAFNFKADGSLAPGVKAQTDAQTGKTTRGYMTHYNDKDDAADAKAIKLFKSQIVAVKNIDNFMNESSVYDFALKAVGINPVTESSWKIERVLKSDLSDPKSYVYQLKDDRYLQLAKAFNFTSKGEIGAPVLVQPQLEIQNTARNYIVQKSRFGTKEDKEKATAETKYYTAEVAKVTSLQEFLAKPRLVEVALVANGIDPKSVDSKFLKDAFTSDLDDPKSFVNTQKNAAYRSLVASFNFDTKGALLRDDRNVIQTRRGLVETYDRYIRQTLETQSGVENAGVRLALYMERSASNITSFNHIIGDTALAEVFRVALSLPASMGSMDIKVQARLLDQKFDLEDLKDPEKLKKFLTRFTMMYDMENDAAQNPVLSLFSRSSGAGISGNLLMSLSQLRAR